MTVTFSGALGAKLYFLGAILAPPHSPLFSALFLHSSPLYRDGRGLHW